MVALSDNTNLMFLILKLPNHTKNQSIIMVWVEL